MDDEERKKKLQAGRERLAKFQKKKVSPDKRRKKKPKTTGHLASSLGGANGNEGVQVHLSDDSLDAGDSSVTSSDMMGTHSDLVSPISFESDQRSVGTDDLCEDSDGGQLDAEVARIELREARSKIHQLEENLYGKQAALEQVNREMEEMRAGAGLTSNGPSSNGNGRDEGTGSPDKEAEYQAAFEQYNLKIQEFQQALQQRDDVIRHLSTNLQGALYSRDDIQKEASAQTDELARRIQTLQSQLQEAGDSLKEQNGGHSSLSEELTNAKEQVTTLRQTVGDKEVAMQTLAQRYAQKSKELVESIEEKEDLRRHSAEEIVSLQHQLKEQGGDLSVESREKSLAHLQAELDESFGIQIVMIKEQLQERHEQEKDLLMQKCSELERAVETSTRSNKHCEDLEQQISLLKDELERKNSETRRGQDDIANLKQKLAETVGAYENQTEKFYTTQMILDEECSKKEELRAQLDEANQDLLHLQESQDDELNNLKRSLQQHIAEADRLAAINIDYEDQIAKLKADHDEVVAELNTKLETVLDEKSCLVESHSKEVEAHSKEVESLKAELETLQEKSVDAPIDVDELKKTIKEDISLDYEEKMDDMKYSHEVELKRLEGELRVEYQDDLKQIQENLDEQYVQKVESIRAEKDREFVGELQNARQELQEKYNGELSENIEAERKRLKQLELHQTSLDDRVDQADLISRLQNENQDLSEARDALLQQIDSSHHEQEELQEELLNVINEKDRLHTENERLLLDLDALEMKLASSSGLETLHDRLQVLEADSQDSFEQSDGEKSQISDELERLRVELETSKQDKAAFQEQMDKLGEEKSKISGMLKAMRGELESHKSAAIQGEGDDWATERTRLLQEKEELQHLIEKNEKVYEAKVSILGEELHKTSLDERVDQADLISRLQNENQDLSEARDALLQQIDSSHHEQEELQEELLNVTNEKDRLHTENERLLLDLDALEMKLASSSGLETLHDRLQVLEADSQDSFEQSDDEKSQISDELERLRVELETSKQDKAAFQEQMDKLNEDYQTKVKQIGEEKSKISGMLKATRGELESHKSAAIHGEGDDWATERTRLLQEKEELQHLIEKNEKEYEAKVSILEEEKNSHAENEMLLETEKKALNDQIISLENGCDEVKRELNEALSRLNEHQNVLRELEDLKEVMVDLKTKHSEESLGVQNQHADDLEQIEELKKIVNELKQLNAQLKQDSTMYESAKGQIENLTDELSALKSGNEELKMEVSSQISKNAEFGHDLAVMGSVKEDQERLENDLAAASSDNKTIKLEMEQQRESYERQVALLKSIHYEDGNSASGNSGRKSPEMTAAEKQNAILRDSLEQTAEERANVASDLVQLKHEFDLLRTSIDMKEAEITSLREQLQIADDERKHAVVEWQEAEQELGSVRAKLEQERKQRWQIEERLPQLQARLESLQHLETELTLENENLKEELGSLKHERDIEAAKQTEKNLEHEIERLKQDLNKTAAIYTKENSLLKDALQYEKDNAARLLKEKEDNSNEELLALREEVDELKQTISRKEQTEHEILTEKTRQIGILQESNARLENEKEDLQTKLNDLDKKIKTNDSVSEEVQDSFGQQLTELQTWKVSLQAELEQQKKESLGLSDILNESASREDSLKQEKELLLRKLAEKEEVQEKLMQERIALQKRIEEQQKLEALLNEKDCLEQELSRQKRSLECDLRDIEQQLQQREHQLLDEKSNLEAELRHKDIEVRRWEVGFREQRLEFQHQESFLKKRYGEEMTSFRDDAEKDKLARLQRMRQEKDRQHADAVAKLKRDLKADFDNVTMRFKEQHLSEISLLKTRHQSQMDELRQLLEAKLQALQEELENERRHQLGTARDVHERERQRELNEMRDRHEWEMEALRGELDSKHYRIFDEMRGQLEQAYKEEVEQVRREAKNERELELAALRLSKEQIYAGQLEVERAQIEHQRASALTEMRQALVASQQEEMEVMEERWSARLENMEKLLEDERCSRLDEVNSNSKELITRLKRRLSQEHQEVIESLAGEWDQKVLDQLKHLREEMEEKYKAELEAERELLSKGKEGKEELEREHRADVDLLLKERETLLNQAEEMRQNLQRVHQQELLDIQAKVQAEYTQLAKMREDLEQEKGQRESITSLKSELFLLKAAHAELKKQHEELQTRLKGVEDKDLSQDERAKREQALRDEIRNLQDELTMCRAKLNDEHSEELEKLRTYFEERVVENEKRWALEMAELKEHYEVEREHGLKEDEEEGGIPKQRSYGHTMMMMTHLSDVESSPPKSPERFAEIEAEVKQQLRSELRGNLEEEYQARMDNMKEELQHEHRVEIERMNLQTELKQDADLKAAKDALNLRHALEMENLRQNQLEELESLRQKLLEVNLKAVTKLRLECAAETARQVEEESQRIKEELKFAHEEELSQQKDDLEHKLAIEMDSLQGELELQKDIEGKRAKAEAKEEFDSQFRTMQVDLEQQAQDKITDEVARILAEVTMEKAQEMEMMQMVLNQQKERNEELEKKKQDIQDVLDSRIRDEDDFGEKYTNELANLRQQLSDTEATLQTLREGIESGEAPEVQELKENLVRQYDNQLEMIKATMTEEIESLTRTTQLQSAKELEEMQVNFMQEHQALLDKFVESQDADIIALKQQHYKELEEQHERLQNNFEQELNDAQETLQEEQAKELEELRSVLEEEHAKEMSDLKSQHFHDQEALKIELAVTLNEEKAKMEERMEKERAHIFNAEELLESIKAKYEEEKEQVKEDLVSDHMAKFRQVTDELESEHRQELESMKEMLRTSIENEFKGRIRSLEEEIQGQQAELDAVREKHETELIELKQNHEEQLAKLRENHEDQLEAIATDSEREMEAAKSDLEEAHRKEILRLQSDLGERKQGALIALKELHESEIERLKEEHQKEMDDLREEQDGRVKEAVEELMKKHQEEIEKALEELQEQLMHQAEQEKGELDQMMKEKEEQHEEEVKKLQEQSNQLQQENMELVQQIARHDTLISRRERESEEGGNLLSMMRADVDRLNNEKATLQVANNHLLNILTTVVRASIATEETINKQMAKLADATTRSAGEGRSDSREDRTEAEGEAAEIGVGVQQGASGAPPAARDQHHDEPSDLLHDTSVASFFSDEGLELSQQLMESMFSGPDLDTEGEELVSGASTRLQASVDRLLEMVSATADQIQHARSSQAVILNATEASVEEVNHLREDRESLMEQLHDVTEKCEKLGVELHRTGGLMDGLAAEKQELEETNTKLEADKHNMAAELEALRETLGSLEEAQTSLQQERERVEEQKAAFTQRLGEEDLGILQENLRLREEAESAQLERQDTERQAAKDKADLQDQLHHLEAALEEQIARGDTLSEKRKEETDEMRRELEVLEKQLKKNKQFLEQQTIEREQEREEFQREIVRLEGDHRSRDRSPLNIDEIFQKEAQELREELRETSEAVTQAQAKAQQLERDLHFSEDTSQELSSQLKDAERQLDEAVESKQELEAQTEELERDLGEQHHLQAEIMHEKDALQKQLYDQLIQISALQSKLDALKHGVDSGDGTASSDSGEVVTSEVSLLKQLEDDKEALERKDKEIENLVEQLEQFREEIINKDEEISQLNMQIDVDNREQDSGREDLKGQLAQALEEVHQLEDKVTFSQDVATSMPRFAQELLDEKNQEIDHLNEQLAQVMLDLEEAQMQTERPQEAAVGQSESPPEAVESQADEVKRLEQELESQQAELESKLNAKEAEMTSLKQSLDQERNRDVLSHPMVEEKLEALQKHNIASETQHEQEISSLKQMLVVREREVAHLEGLLVRLQEQSPSGSNSKTLKSQIKSLKKDVQDKDAELTQLRLQIDHLEEKLFQLQQQDLDEEPPHQLHSQPPSPSQNDTNWQQLQRDHEERIAELQQKHAKALTILKLRHEEELGHLRDSQSIDVDRLKELEMDYDRKMASLQCLSPGKTLDQKLREIRSELTRQHQEHVCDIQRTMERETQVLMDQLRAEYAQHSRAREERHRHEMEEAVLRVNRDLMAAHAEEVAKIQEDHGRQLERILAATPINASPMSSIIADTANRLSKELRATERLDSRLVSQLKTRQGGVGKERGPTEGAVHNGAGLMNGGDIPQRLQAVLNRLHNEGLQVLSLSDLRYLRQQTSPRPSVQDGMDVLSLQDAWESEKQALLDAIQALKDLITQATKGQWKEKSSESDWRGHLLQAIQSVFDRERDALLAELRTHVTSSGDRDLSEVQQLERKIREQEAHHKSAMEQIYSADRVSLLAEIEDVRAHSKMLAVELQEQRTKLTSQLNSVEEHGTSRERQLKRQLEMMEHKYRQERVLVEDLQTSLTIEKEKVSQLADALNKEKNLVMELQNEISELQIKQDRLMSSKERLEAKLAEVTAQLESEKSHSRSLRESLETEEQSMRHLHETLESEMHRTAKVKQREQDVTKELRQALESERNKLVERHKDLEKAKIRADGLKRDLDAERSMLTSLADTEQSKISDLKTALDVEKTRCQELHAALHREQALNTQLHESLDQERSAYTENSHYEKSTIGELQALLDNEKSQNLDLRTRINQLENNVEGLQTANDRERRHGGEAVEEERVVCRQLKATIDSLQGQQEDLNRKLSAEQERVTLIQQECDRLKAALLSQKEEGRERDIIREKERQIERQRHRERERERELERQRQSDFQLERELDRQKIESLERNFNENKIAHEVTSTELKKLREAQRHFTPRVTEDELQQAYEEELSRGSPRRSPQGSAFASRLQLYKAQLEAVRQRLQLLAVRQQEEIAKLYGAGLETDQQELATLQRGLTETLSELKQLHASLALHSESTPSILSPTTATRLNDRLLSQNAELSNFASRLSEEKTEMRTALAKLEEEVWRFRQREAQLDEATRRSLDNTDIALAEERALWGRERQATQNALQQAESQITHLKAQLQQEATRRDGGSPLLTGTGEISEHQQLKLQKMYGKYLRAESFRKALVYQKRYLLLLLGGFQDCEQATLQLIAKMGAYPNPEDLERRSRHSKAFSRFRSSVRVVIAISRLKFLVRKWRRATRVGTPSITSSVHLDAASSPPHMGLPSTSIPNIRVSTPIRSSLPTGIHLVNGASPPVRDIVGQATSRTIFPSGHHRARSSSPVLFHGATAPSPHPDGRPTGYHSASPMGRILSRSLDRPLDRPLDTTMNGDPEASLTDYIQKLETLQQRLGAHIAGDVRPTGYSAYSKR